MKIQHWSAFRSIFPLKGPWVLVFGLAFLCGCAATRYVEQPIEPAGPINPRYDYLAELTKHERALAGTPEPLEGKRPSPERSRNLQMLAAARAALGDERGAIAAFTQAFGAVSKPASPEKNAAAMARVSQYKKEDAVDAIAHAAAGHRIVILNEAHHVSRHRHFALQVAKRLRELGFTFLSCEAFHENEAKLIERGYPNASSGYYLRDPTFAHFVRDSMRMGYQPYAHEAENLSGTGDRLTQITEREVGQAKKVAALLATNPDAKVFIFVGFGHISEKWTTHKDGREEGWFAAQLQKLTGINPLTIEQTEMTEPTPGLASRPLWDAAFANGDTRPLVLRNPDGAYLVGDFYAGAVDMQVFHPPDREIDGRPGWLAGDPERRAYRIPESVMPQSGRRLMQAFIQDERDLPVPIDQVVLEAGKPAPPLLLPPGQFRFVYRDFPPP